MESLGVTAPVTQKAKEMLDALSERGYGDKDPSWLVLQMEKMDGLNPKEFN